MGHCAERAGNACDVNRKYEKGGLMRTWFIAALMNLLTFNLAFAQTGKLDKIRMMYATVNATVSQLWVAKESGIFRQNGLELEMLYGAQRTIESLLAGELAFVEIAGPVPIAARLSGADLVILTASINSFPFVFMVSPDIHAPEDLKGKILGVTRIGASSDVALRMALQKKGLDPNRDVAILPQGGFQELYAGMEKKAIAGALFGPPILNLLKNKGYKEFLDLRFMGVETQHTGVVAQRSLVKNNPDLVRRYIKAYVEGIHRLKADKEFGLKVIGRYTKVDKRAVLEDAYNFYAVERFRNVPTPSVPGVKTILNQMALKDPRAKAANPEDFVDSRFVDELENSGFISNLYK